MFSLDQFGERIRWSSAIVVVKLIWSISSRLSTGNPRKVETSFRCIKESKVDRVNELRDEYAPHGVSESRGVKDLFRCMSHR